jgi:hypothetical protein
MLASHRLDKLGRDDPRKERPTSTDRPIGGFVPQRYSSSCALFRGRREIDRVRPSPLGLTPRVLPRAIPVARGFSFQRRIPRSGLKDQRPRHLNVPSRQVEDISRRQGTLFPLDSAYSHARDPNPH